MTTPTQARQRSGYGPRTYAWPPLPPHEFEVISVTSALNAGVAKPYLVGWAAKVTAEAAIEDHEVIGALLAKGKEKEAIAHVKGARFADSGAKADRGTIVHGALESYLAGRPLSQETVEAQLKERRVPLNLWKSTAGMLAGVMEFLSDEEPEVYWSESTVYSREHGYAGTADLIARMRVGGKLKPVVVDVKTSKAVYSETAAQLVAYARADFVGLDDGTEEALTPTGEPVEHGVVVRPKADGTYEKAVFTLSDDVYAFFLGALAVAKNAGALDKRPAAGMTEGEREKRRTRLTVDVDTRLTDVWLAVWQPGGVLRPILEDEITREAFGAAVRAAYAYGYRDALDDDARGRRGELARANGY